MQNPPTMIAMVMLMTMSLLGKHEFSPYGSGSSATIRHDRKSFDATAMTDDTSSSGGQSKKRTRLEPSQPRPPPQTTYAGKDYILSLYTCTYIEFIGRFLSLESFRLDHGCKNEYDYKIFVS